MKIVGILV